MFDTERKGIRPQLTASGFRDTKDKSRIPTTHDSDSAGYDPAWPVEQTSVACYHVSYSALSAISYYKMRFIDRSCQGLPHDTEIRFHEPTTCVAENVLPEPEATGPETPHSRRATDPTVIIIQVYTVLAEIG